MVVWFPFVVMVTFVLVAVRRRERQLLGVPMMRFISRFERNPNAFRFFGERRTPGF
jgi:hypothetical protein